MACLRREDRAMDSACKSNGSSSSGPWAAAKAKDRWGRLTPSGAARARAQRYSRLRPSIAAEGTRKLEF